MNKSLMRSRWAAVGAAVAVTLGGGAVWVANAATNNVSPDNTFYALSAPCRLMDTRLDGDSGATNLGPRKGFVGPVSAGGTVNNDITVIFDIRAVQVGDKFTLKYGDFDKRPIMGRCDEAFKTGDLQSATNPTAVLLNVTTLGANTTTGLSQNFSLNGYVTVYPWTTLTGTGVSVTGRPVFSNLNPVSGLPSVHNNVTVQLAPITSGVEMPNVACSGGLTWGNESCQYYDGNGPAQDQLKAFRLFNANASIHVVIDVLGYYAADVA